MVILNSQSIKSTDKIHFVLPMKHNMLSVSQAAQLKGISRAAIYGAIARGRLAHQLIVGHIALRQADVEAWSPRGFKTGRPKGTPMSSEAKVRISQGQKRRWQQRKQETPSS